MSVAFIGLGSMGGPLAQLIAKEHDLAVYDPVPDAINRFERKARLASSPADAARDADIICICVRDDKQVNDVIYGAGGVAETMKEDALILIHSTISIDGMKALSGKLAEQGVNVIDAPVSSTSQNREDKFVFCMLGGDSKDVERARPVVETFATGFEHMGPLGSGMAIKIANNMVTWTHIVVGTQAASVALRSGVAPEKLLAVMKANGNLTPTVGALLGGKLARKPGENPQMDAFMKSQGGIGEKDLQLAAEMLKYVGASPDLALQGQSMVMDVMTKAV